MSFSVTILGSSSALPTSKRNLTAHLLNIDERFFLIDCGEGTQIQLRKFKQSLGKINHIFISHLHGDHVMGLFGLIASYNLLGRKQDLNIYAHRGLKNILEDNLKYFGFPATYKLNVVDINPQRKKIIYEDDKIVVQTIPLKHRIPTCGFLFKEKPKPLNVIKSKISEYNLSIKQILSLKQGNDIVLENGEIISNHTLTLPGIHQRSYAFCSDTAYKESISEVIKDVDLLYHETTFLEKDSDRAKETLHTTTTQAATIASLASAKKLIIGHFSARYKTTDLFLEQARKVFEETYLANDGDTHEIELYRD